MWLADKYVSSPTQHAPHFLKAGALIHQMMQDSNEKDKIETIIRKREYLTVAHNQPPAQRILIEERKDIIGGDKEVVPVKLLLELAHTGANFENIRIFQAKACQSPVNLLLEPFRVRPIHELLVGFDITEGVSFGTLSLLCAVSFLQ